MNLLKQLAFNHARGPAYQEEAPLEPGFRPAVRLIAFYLPQFHPIPENDAWWGKGFTDWTNVSKALPRFQGHYQPHLPGELGFCDPCQPRVLRRQAELARAHGIEGFCFHHYWFSGKPLLETPIRTLLENSDIALPFCINWANENWTRRWDGNDREVLIAQTYSPADDLAFAASLEPFLRDPRYIRIEGRPLIMVLCPGDLPDASATMRRWRAHFASVGLGDPYLVMPQGYGDDDPRAYGMDAAAGFPPHRSGLDAADIRDTLTCFDCDFRGRVVRYADMVSAALANRPTGFRFFPGVCPNFDSEARRPNRGFCTAGATPALWRDWLMAACERALAMERPDERIVIINAWNEWAEGAHLEPDRHFGYAWLAETARVMATLSGLDLDSLRRRATAPPEEAPRRSRTARELARLVVKNLAFHGANLAEAMARSLRRWV
jgi:Glycosyltransferase WbsX